MREQGRWRAEIRKADGSILKILVGDSGHSMSITTTADTLTAETTIAEVKKAIDTGSMSYRRAFAPCPLYPRKRTSEHSRGMSALCQKRTFHQMIFVEDASRVKHVHHLCSVTGQTFDIAQLTTKPTRQPKMTSATLCRPCSTPVSLEWDVSPAAITMAAVIGA